MSSNRPKSNPWNKTSQPQRPQKSKKAQNSQNNVLTSNGNLGPSAAENKFKEAHQKLQDAVKKHIKDYESSSDEEELDSINLIDGILKNYTQTGGSVKDATISKTQAFIEEAFQSGANTCLICISRIKRDNQVWSCNNCFGLFHLMCIQRWSKDTLTQQKQSLEDGIQKLKKELTWCCPKCRSEYFPTDIPSKYLCFCGKLENPKHDPFLVPHSCGEICKKDLVPACGHKCLLLCHPGPCPPCPVTVNVTCHCGSSSSVTRRCSHRGWSCGNRCGQSLSCDKHSCSEPCHPGDCQPCSKKSIQKCMCGSQQKLRDCAEPIWQCEKVCGKSLDCGKHKCQEICHAGVCNTCPLTLPRTCPCGKEKYQLPCTEDIPTCKDTCGKLLDCEMHPCNQRCHYGACGLCLETVTKFCRCGQHSKEIQCCKEYLCDTKCKNIRDCNKHACNRKCCDGNCPPCEKPCGRTLQCGNHKCPSVCHRGLCYPCQEKSIITCRCGATKIEAPCGKKHRTKPPKCSKLCLIPPDCHHNQRLNHKCHFGDCPSCKQICNKPRATCQHPCSATCHSAVLVKVTAQKASMPWEQSGPQVERKCLSCPDCTVPVLVTCLGDHETIAWPCHLAKPKTCGRPCGRMLDCTNHFCSTQCHVVEGSSDKLKAGSNCEKCESPCSKPRPDGCIHECRMPCHPGDCPPCKQMLRIKCHCGLTQPYVKCSEWLNLEKREELQSCGNQCPKNYTCGHRCKTNCHSGDCPTPESCKKKVKITCDCKRIRKEFSCETVRKNLAKIECDEICAKKLEEENVKKQELDEIRKKEEEIKNAKELERYQKMFNGKKKNKERKTFDENINNSFLKKYWLLILSGFVVIFSFVVYKALI